jgi:hypothetical protein
MKINIRPNTTQTPDPVQLVEETIARYSSNEQRRLALRRALTEHPNDPSLRKAVARLTGLHQIRKAASTGIFINYARTDELFALEITLRLQRQGFPVWMDMMDINNLDWNREVYQAMQTSALMLSIISPRALLDEQARTERERFTNFGKLVLPVVTRPCDVPGFPLWLTPIKFYKGFNHGIQRLLHTLQPNEAIAS